MFKNSVMLLSIIALGAILFYGYFYYKAMSSYNKSTEIINQVNYNMIMVDEEEYRKWKSEFESSENKWIYDNRDLLALKDLGVPQDLNGIKELYDYKIPPWAIFDTKANKKNLRLAIFKAKESRRAFDGKFYYYEENGHVLGICVFPSTEGRHYLMDVNGQLIETFKHINK